jgi:hypothetical protein
MPRSLHGELARAAKRENVSLNQYVVFILATHGAERVQPASSKLNPYSRGTTVSGSFPGINIVTSGTFAVARGVVHLSSSVSRALITQVSTAYGAERVLPPSKQLNPYSRGTTVSALSSNVLSTAGISSTNEAAQRAVDVGISVSRAVTTQVGAGRYQTPSGAEYQIIRNLDLIIRNLDLVFQGLDHVKTATTGDPPSLPSHLRLWGVHGTADTV